MEGAVSDAKPEEIAREKVERAEAGDAGAAAELGTLEETDGPAQRGVSR